MKKDVREDDGHNRITGNNRSRERDLSPRNTVIEELVQKTCGKDHPEYLNCWNIQPKSAQQQNYWDKNKEGKKIINDIVPEWRNVFKSLFYQYRAAGPE